MKPELAQIGNIIATYAEWMPLCIDFEMRLRLVWVVAMITEISTDS